MSGETHYKAVLEAARVRNRSLERGIAKAPPSVRQGVCDHGTPCGCYAEGHAAGLAEGYAQRRNDPLGDLAMIRRVLDHINESAGGSPTGLSYRSLDADPRLGRPGRFMSTRHSTPEAWKTSFACPRPQERRW